MSSKKIIDLRNSTPHHSEQSSWRPDKEQKRLPLRTRRRRTRAVWLIAGFIFLGASAYGVHWASYAPQVRIQQVSINGAYKLKPGDIRSHVLEQLSQSEKGFLSGANMFFYSRESIERDLQDVFPRIKLATIMKDSFFSRSLTVSLQERQPVARWCAPVAIQEFELELSAEQCFQIDETGFIFANVSATSLGAFSTPYVFYGGVVALDDERESYIGRVFAPGHFASMLVTLRILQQEAGVTPRIIIVENEQDYLVELQEAYRLKVTFDQGAEVIGRNMKLLLASDPLVDKMADLEYLDLRFGNRVYYKFKESAETEVQQ